MIVDLILYIVVDVRLLYYSKLNLCIIIDVILYTILDLILHYNKCIIILQ